MCLKFQQIVSNWIVKRILFFIKWILIRSIVRQNIIARLMCRDYMYILLRILQCTYTVKNTTMIRQGSQRAVCMWEYII